MGFTDSFSLTLCYLQAFVLLYAITPEGEDTRKMIYNAGL